MSLKIKRRRITTGRIRDEEELKQIAINEVGDLIESRSAELGFVLPSVTITANAVHTGWFVRTARHELNKWHTWLNSWLGSGNKRRVFRMRDQLEYAVLMSGVLICNGEIENFSQFEKRYRDRIRHGSQEVFTGDSCVRDKIRGNNDR
jgi:hypothetical protein